MTDVQSTATSGFPPDQRRRHARSLTIQGVLIAILGVVAILLPVVATLAVTLLLGALLLAFGLVEIVRCVRAWRQVDGGWHQGLGWALLQAVAAIVAGGIMLFNPFAGAVSLTLVLGVFLLLAGAMKAVIAWRLRPAPGWGWMAFSAVLSLVLGILVLAGLPGTGLLVPGMFLGIELLFFGAALFMLARAMAR
ncbi:MAG: HdeD family acid-resistance protein [Reyranellaceae bacterium]